jgi:DNA polymerase III delta prime subunit
MEMIELVVDLGRARSGADPFAFEWGTQEYIRRLSSGARRAATLGWSDALRDDIQALTRTPPSSEARARLGALLRAFLLGLGWELDEAALLEAVARGQPVCVRLCFAAAELFVLPWEVLAVGEAGRTLGSLEGVYVRYTWPGVTIAPPLEPKSAERLLFLWSDRGGRVPARQHTEALTELAEGGAAPEIVASAGYGDLARALRQAHEEGRPFTRLHLLAHGAPTADGRGIGLALDDGVVDALTLAELIGTFTTNLRGVTLCACRSSDPGLMESVLGSVARELHRCGVQSVVASRFPLSVQGSVLLTQTLYRELDKIGGGWDRAVGLARRALRESEWAADASAIQHYCAAPIAAPSAKVSLDPAPRPTPRMAQAATVQSRDLTVLRDRVKRFWIEGLLTRTLQGAEPVEVLKETRPEAVERPWEGVLEVPHKESEVLPPGTSIFTVFKDLEGSLLILGLPGAGKTITLLSLCRELVREAEQEPTSPVPVVFLLSSWKGQRLGVWLEEELGSKYQVPREVGRAWLAENRLTLLLDGLDEVPEASQAPCVVAINSYLAEVGAGGVVVSCRAEEYSGISTLLRLNGALALQPLSGAQIQAWIEAAGPRLAGLSEAVKQDPVLAELARSPMMLQVMQRAYSDVPVAELEAIGGAQSRLHHLFERFIERAYPVSKGEEAERLALLGRLSWLARGLGRTQKTLFLIEELQPEWLERPAQRGAWALLYAVVLGVIMAVPAALNWGGFGWVSVDTRAGLRGFSGATALCDLSVEPLMGVPWTDLCVIPLTWHLGMVPLWLLILMGIEARAVKVAPALSRSFAAKAALPMVVWGLLLGAWALVAPTTPPPLTLALAGVSGVLLSAIVLILAARGRALWGAQPVERLSFTARAALSGALGGLIVSIAPTVTYWSLLDESKTVRIRGYSPETLHGDEYFAIAFAAVGMVVGGIMWGHKALVREERVRSNAGMRATLITALGVSGRAAVSVSLTLTLLAALMQSLPHGLVRTAGLIVSGSIMATVGVGLAFGGAAVIAHLLLRLMLRWTGQLPLRVTELLGAATDRGLLLRAGGAWLFPHRSVQEYFAARAEPPPPAEPQR